MHVAAALDIPQVAVIGSTDTRATAPVNAASVMVQQPGACDRSPCLKPHCPIGDQRCMTAISVDMVMEAVSTLLYRSKEA